MFVAIERFISDVVEEYGETIQFPQMEVVGTHSQVCKFLKIKHHIHSSLRKVLLLKGNAISKTKLMKALMMTTFHAEKRRNVH